jgi:lysophospholipase L1-like esterase
MTRSVPDTNPADEAPKGADCSLPEGAAVSADEGPRRKYTLRARLLLALGSTIFALVVSLLLGEFVFWVFDLAPKLRVIELDDVDSPYQRSTNPILGYEHKANYRNDHPDSVLSFASTNSHGQRDIERSLEKPPGVRRILLLGDSVVESLEVEKLDDMMNRQLEMLYPDGKTEVLNFGVNGYCTLAEVELLRTKGLKFKPDLVVLVFVENDFSNFNGALGGTAADIEALQQGQRLPSQSGVYKFFIDHSCLFRTMFAPRRNDNPVEWNRKAVGDNNVVRGLELLRKLADEQGFDVLVAVWPSFEDDGIVDTKQLYGSKILVIEVLAALNRLPSVRLSPYFQEHWDSHDLPGTPRTYYTIGDSMHVNEAGSRAAAEVLKDVIDNYPNLKANSPDATSLPQADLAVTAAQQMGGDYDFATAITLLGHALEEEGRLDEALRYYQLALEIDPDSKSAHWRLGNFYLQNDELAKGHYHLLQAQQ